MLRETQTAKQFKGGSDPGVCGALAATNPLRFYRHFGVAPALEDVLFGDANPMMKNH
ncbi:MAG: hypothetical protein WA637_17575 [Terriglobales bacterium]